MIYPSLPISASIIEDNACAVNHEARILYLPEVIWYWPKFFVRGVNNVLKLVE